VWIGEREAETRTVTPKATNERRKEDSQTATHPIKPHRKRLPIPQVLRALDQRHVVHDALPAYPRYALVVLPIVPVTALFAPLPRQGSERRGALAGRPPADPPRVVDVGVRGRELEFHVREGVEEVSRGGRVLAFSIGGGGSGEGGEGRRMQLDERNKRRQASRSLQGRVAPLPVRLGPAPPTQPAGP
jgi:hypothetical protein